MSERDTKGCGEAGGWTPEIDRNRCEGKAACVAVCPMNVFAIEPLRDDDRAGLSLLGRLKAWAHGGKQAYAVRADACHGCNRCVYACPERAITVRPVR
ncbi:MAG: ferredoxin family protein [Myxococcales bacterium]|nr:ferredoxin family protein [Myxococcales bacterium]